VGHQENANLQPSGDNIGAFEDNIKRLLPKGLPEKPLKM
jgi:hypothetical protein